MTVLLISVQTWLCPLAGKNWTKIKNVDEMSRIGQK